MSNNKRDNSIDAAAGLMITVMVLGHIGSEIPLLWLNFFMPWFFYKSGHFFHNQQVSKMLRGVKSC